MILAALGGISLFLLGIILAKQGFKSLHSKRLQGLTISITNNFFLASICGGLLTILIQSSSATLIIIIALLNSDLIDLKRAIALMMGANVGTTFTLQLISFPLSNYVVEFIIVASILFFIYLLFKIDILKSIALIIIALAFIYQGVDLLEVIAVGLKRSTLFINLITIIISYPLLGIAIGALFTALIQSSSTFSGIVVIIAKAGLINLLTAVSLILGSNLGTCITAVLATIDDRNLATTRLVVAHIAFNLLGILIVIPILPLFIYLIAQTAINLEQQIANAHTLFNLTAYIVLFYFRDYFIRAIKFIVEKK